MQRALGVAQSILNGVLGDHLERTGNGLALDMELIGANDLPKGSKIVVLVYGLMCTEDVWTMSDGSDYGTLLARDFGYVPLKVRYNSGRPVAENGKELARLLDELVTKSDVAEIALVGFSMGGLLVRSACHFGRANAQPWVDRVKRAFYLGTPHLGSPWERAGRVLTRVLRAVPDPYTRLAADLGDVRSRGIKDLGDPCHPYPLLPSIRHHLVAGFVDERLARAFGDALVPLASGTDGACDHPRALPPANVKILPRVSHLELARHEEVYAHIRAWCEEAS